MDVDAKRPGGRQKGIGSMRTRGRGVKNWQNLADVFYGWPLRRTYMHSWFVRTLRTKKTERTLRTKKPKVHFYFPEIK